MKPTPGAAYVALALALLQGCAADPASAAGEGAPEARPAAAQAPKAGPAASAPVAKGAGLDEPVASVNGRAITYRQMMEPLVAAHGLPVLLNVVQLELAKQEAARAGVVVTEEDIRAEREQTVKRMFQESDQKLQEKIDAAIAKKKFDEAEKLKEQMARDQDQLLDQFLAQQKVSRPEFELVLRTNAYLRKIAEPRVKDQITDEHLRKAFETDYGASIRVRHIQGNPQELAQALERVRAGEPFEQVAEEMSRNRATAGLGGELPRFSLSTAGLPQNFKQAAFDLKVGEVSSMVEADGAYHIIKLEEKFAPKAVKFENVKDIISANLQERAVQMAVKQLRDRLAAQARRDLKISDPVLKEQFAEKLSERDKQIKDQQQLRDQLEKERAQEAEQLKAAQEKAEAEAKKQPAQPKPAEAPPAPPDAKEPPAAAPEPAAPADAPPADAPAKAPAAPAGK